MKTKLITIVGPTASGKTGLAIELAKRYKGEVISADSRQVYRHLDIGTEKVTEDEQQGIPHHLIDVADPREVYTVSNYKHDAQKVIEEISSRGNLPIIAGGTGFYIDALLYDINMPHVPPNPALRAKLDALEAQDLFSLLIEKDPRRASTIDPFNKRRLIRALEIIDALGSVPEDRKRTLVYDALVLGIKHDEDILKKRIESRLTETMKLGLIEEVTQLKKNGLSWERLYELGLEYRIIADYLQGSISESEIVPRMLTALRQYAKRQMTWFKRNEDIRWIALDEREQIDVLVTEFLK